jgi:hypothetical protein
MAIDGGKIMSRTTAPHNDSREHTGLATLAALAVLAAVVAGCAGSTVRSGVGDTYLSAPPWYAGAAVLAGPPIAHLPISYQPSGQLPVFELSGAEGAPLTALLADMNAYLDGLGRSVRIAAPAGTAPDVQFGCDRTPGDGCEGADSRRPMRLAVGRPSRAWVDGAAAAAGEAGAGRVLVLTLEIANYLPRQRDLRGSKEIQLGTGHTVDVPWLTALDKPASVLQLTGALVDDQGRAVRIGAEGLFARRTGLLLAAIGGLTSVSDEDVERLRTARRDDLPGKPFVWQAALGALIAQLTRDA